LESLLREPDNLTLAATFVSGGRPKKAVDRQVVTRFQASGVSYGFAVLIPPFGIWKVADGPENRSFSAMDLRKIKDRAHELDRAGRHSKAVAVYETLIELQPGDAGIRLRHADACRKAGRIEPALKSYLLAAGLMSAAGQTARARAVTRAAHQLAPSNQEVTSALENLERRLQPSSSIQEALESLTEQIIDRGDPDFAAEELEVEVATSVPLDEDSPIQAGVRSAGPFGAVEDPFEVVWLCPEMVSLQLAGGTWVTISAETALELKASGPPASPAEHSRSRRHVDA
jgi:tetratricopeptide (TPR) repeat protein